MRRAPRRVRPERGRASWSFGSVSERKSSVGPGSSSRRETLRRYHGPRLAWARSRCSRMRVEWSIVLEVGPSPTPTSSGQHDGVIFRTRLTKDTGPDAPVITLCTAVRYAVGIGDARTVAISDDATSVGSRAVTVHDIMPYLGSSVGVRAWISLRGGTAGGERKSRPSFSLARRPSRRARSPGASRGRARR